MYNLQCPPCRGFTPKLVDTYKKLKEENKNIETVFISSDRSEEQYKEYYDTMPWLSLPYGSPLKKELSEYFEVEGINMYPIFHLVKTDKFFCLLQVYVNVYNTFYSRFDPIRSNMYSSGDLDGSDMAEAATAATGILMYYIITD